MQDYRCDEYKFGFIYQKILAFALSRHSDVDVEGSNFTRTLTDLHEFSMRVLSRSVMMYVNNLYRSSVGQSFQVFFHTYKREFLLNEQTFNDFYMFFEEAFSILLNYYEQSIKNYKDVLKLLATHKKDIVEEFVIDPNHFEITDLDLAKGDKHVDGLGTASFRVNGVLYYIKWKDASLDLYHHNLYEYFQHAVRNGRSAFDLGILPLRDFYIQRGIEPREVESVDSYFNNCGIFLFVTYLISGSDFHYENVISTLDTVITIDSENVFNFKEDFTVFDTSLVTSFSVREKTLAAFSNNYGGDLDINTYTFTIGDDGIEKELQVTEKESNTHNVPSYKGEVLSFYKHKHLIIEGFEKAYDFFLAQKTEVVTLVKSLFTNKEARVIDKHTYIYSDAIWSSYTPRLLTDKSLRRSFLDDLGIFNETETPFLLEGFVPYKTRAITIPDNYFSKFHLHDKQKQVTFIEEAYLLEERRDLEYNEKAPVNMEEILNNCYANLLKKQVPMVDGVSWLEVLEKGNTLYRDFQIEPMPETIYYGKSGIYLFLLKYFNHFPEKKDHFPDFEQELERFIRQFSEKVKATPSVQNGLLDGAAGLLWLMAEREQQQDILSLAEFLSENVNNDQSYDIVSGSAGLLKVFLALYERPSFSLDKQELFSYIVQVKNHLLEHVYSDGEVIGWISKGMEVDVNYGYSHGLAGYLPVLYETYKITGDESVLIVVEKGLKHLLSVKEEGRQTWPTSNLNDKALTNWCHGTPGILLSLVELHNKGFRVIDLKSIILSNMDTLTQTEKDSVSLCHGRFGNHFIGLYIARSLEEKELVFTFTKKINEDFHHSFTETGIQMMYKSFMIGYSGILYMYLAFKEQGLL